MAIYQDALVSKNEVLYISGQTPSKGDFVSESINDQLDVVLDKIVSILNAHQLKIENLVKITIYITSRDYLKAIRDKISERFGEHKPTCTLLIVSGLVDEKFKVEIDAVASL